MLKEAGKRWVGWLMVTLLVAALSYGVGVWSAPVTSFGIDGSGNLDVNGVESNTLRVAALTSGRIPISGINGLIGDDADLTWSGGNTLNSPQVAINGLTVGRIPIVGTGGLIGDDADFTYNATTKTLTVKTVTVENANIIINGQTITSYIESLIATALQNYTPTPPGVPPSTYDYTFWKTGTTYYLRNEATNATTSNTSFDALWAATSPGFVSGDVVFFTGNTDYVINAAIDFATVNVTLRGEVDGSGVSTSMIRAYSSTSAPASPYLVRFRGDNTTLIGMGFSGLGYSDGWDWDVSYDLLRFYQVDNAIMENCTVQHTQEYLFEMYQCANYTVRGSVFRYGQNGISTAGNGNSGVMENNTIYGCSQAAIKLRGDTGSIVHNNTINLEYTYWRAFDHDSIPGPDGRGVVGNTEGANGVYFGVTDPNPSFNVDVHDNVITDVSIHHTVLVQDVVDGTWRYGPQNSYGLKFPNDSGAASTGNWFQHNTVTGTYYSAWIQNYAARGQPPNPATVHGNTFTSTVVTYCNLS